MNIYRPILYILILIQLASCSEEFQSKLKSTPSALGTANQIVVIADDALWESEIGDTFRFYYEAAYPMLPTPEPMYDLKHYTPQDLINGPIRKELRTYLYLADLSDNGSETAQEIAKDIGEEKYMKIKQEGSGNNIVGRDKWAVGQIMVYLAGKDKEDLVKNIINSFSSVSKRIYEHDFKQIRGYAYSSGYNKALNAEVEEKMGIRMNIPAEYIKAEYEEEENMIWLRKETAMASFSIVIKSIPYSSEKQLTKENLKKLINQFGKEHVTTNTPGSYLVVNDEDLPLYTHTREINGQYTYEMRGVWEATKDYMGGPFFAYLVIDKSQKKLIFIYDFLLAPGKRKRDLMQRMELVTNTIEIL